MKYRNSDFLKDLYYRRQEFAYNLSKARRSGNPVLINTIRKLNNCRWGRKLNGDVSIQDIFIDEFDNFVKDNPKLEIRDAVFDNVNKMIKCGNFDYGYLYYECPNCENYHIQGFTCKSRFCPRCGKKYRDKVGTKVASKLLKIKHKQLVFTIPFEMRKYFRKYRQLLSLLFEAVNETLTETLRESAPKAFKKEKRKLGFVSFLHTYGRDMKRHPHIHVLYAEKFMRQDGTLGNFYYLHFEAIRKRFLYTILNLAKKRLKEIDEKSYKKFLGTEKVILNKFKNGSYFYGKATPNGSYSIESARATAKYIARYASHPAISERRIISYDEKTKIVKWFYDPHEDDLKEDGDEKLGRQFIEEHAYEFIKRLIIHIPENNFVQIRYYGFYSNKFSKKDSLFNKLFSSKDIEKMMLKLEWKQGLLYAFGYNPLLCECGAEMVYNPDHSFFPEFYEVNTTRSLKSRKFL